MAEMEFSVLSRISRSVTALIAGAGAGVVVVFKFQGTTVPDLAWEERRKRGVRRHSKQHRLWYRVLNWSDRGKWQDKYWVRWWATSKICLVRTGLLCAFQKSILKYNALSLVSPADTRCRTTLCSHWKRNEDTINLGTGIFSSSPFMFHFTNFSPFIVYEIILPRTNCTVSECL
jgi:hypothetical protein